MPRHTGRRAPPGGVAALQQHRPAGAAIRGRGSRLDRGNPRRGCHGRRPLCTTSPPFSPLLLPVKLKARATGNLTGLGRGGFNGERGATLSGEVTHRGVTLSAERGVDLSWTTCPIHRLAPLARPNEGGGDLSELPQLPGEVFGARVVVALEHAQVPVPSDGGKL